MKRALLRDTLREIWHSKGRFLSIFTIILLGVAFFAGLKAAGPDMKKTADAYFHSENLMDLRVVSTLGLDEENLDALSQMEGVAQVDPAYTYDVIMKKGEGESVVRLHSMPGEGGVNQPRLAEGRLPEKSGECVLGRGKFQDEGLSLGDSVTFVSGSGDGLEEVLARDTFTVVGFVDSPAYISFERGSSTIGSGSVAAYCLIPEEDFALEAYTDAYLVLEKEGAAESAYSEEYARQVDDKKAELEALGEEEAQARGDRIRGEAEEKIAEAEQELADAKTEFDREIADGEAELAKARREIDDGRTAMSKAKEEYNRQIAQGESALAEGKKQMDEKKQELTAAQEEWAAQKPQAQAAIQAGEAALAESREKLAQSRKELDALRALLDSGSVPESQRPALEARLSAGEAAYQQGAQELAAGEAELSDRKEEFAAAEKKLEEAQAAIARGETELAAKEKELAAAKTSGKKQLDAAEKELAAAEEEYAAGRKELGKGRAEGQEKIAEGESKLADAQAQLEELAEPKWYTMTREDNPGYGEYTDAADRMNAMAQVFPTLFYFIAAFVCLNTMTRMVDEQRTLIGTYKGLGYAGGAIAGKYLLYAGIASILGSAAGVAIGNVVLPRVVFGAYSIMFTLPPLQIGFYPETAVTSAVLAVLITTLAAYFACRRELAGVPSQLMRPRAPKSGKRVWLEYVGFIWNHLSFTRKVTARNLFRYKKRFLMTVFGIAGSMALLLAGFGLRDSVSNIVTYQFGELYQYGLTIGFETEGADLEKIENEVLSGGEAEEMLFMASKTMDAAHDGKKMSVSLMVPRETDQLSEYIILRNRLTHEAVPFDDSGVLLTEKAAGELGVSAGDSIELREGETQSHAVRVSGIIENYAHHYVYISPDLYGKTFGSEPEYNSALVKTGELTKDQRDAYSSRLLATGDIGLVNFTEDLMETFSDMIETLSLVVMVLIVSAGALALLILYNLTNINVSERFREIATIKVLGFYDREVLSYVYRENFILAGIGMVLGIFLGMLLHTYIITTVEVNAVMFGRTINPLSFVYSCALTILFALLVNWMMYFKLKKIDMVEALKTVE